MCRPCHVSGNCLPFKGKSQCLSSQADVHMTYFLELSHPFWVTVYYLYLQPCMSETSKVAKLLVDKCRPHTHIFLKCWRVLNGFNFPKSSRAPVGNEDLFLSHSKKLWVMFGTCSGQVRIKFESSSSQVRVKLNSQFVREKTKALFYFWNFELLSIFVKMPPSWCDQLLNPNDGTAWIISILQSFPNSFCGVL
jgi:hypothetical protein